MATEEDILLPAIGDFDAVEIIEIAVNPGDIIAAEDTLLTLESDKATMDIPAPKAGEVKRLMVKVGDKVAEGAPILRLLASAGQSDGDSAGEAVQPEPESAATVAETAPDTAPPAPASAPPKPAEPMPPASAPPKPAAATPPAAPQTPAPARTGNEAARVHAGPSVRRFARELGVDLAQVTGSGRKGRIQREDVMAFAKGVLSRGAAAEPRGLLLPEVPAIDFARFGEIEARPLSRIRRRAGQSLHQSWITAPHVTQFDEADITELEAFRKSQRDAAKAEGARLTLLAFLVKAVVFTLQKFPEFNASLAPGGAQIILKKYYHIGVAVNTDQGLVVTVIRDADQKGLFDIARAITELGDKARAGRSAPEELQGGSFTISSLGGIGGLHFTPIINPPEVAILGVSRAAIKPVHDNGAFVPRLILPYAVSYDHRVIDGVAGAEFSRCLGGLLADIRQLLL